MKLKELLTNPCDIMVRSNGPYGNEMYMGQCKWDGEKLESVDGDIYTLEDEVFAYIWNDGNLIYWEYCPNWCTGNGDEYIDCKDTYIKNIINRYEELGVIINGSEL